MSLSDETTGMIKGLAEVFKSQQQLQSTAIQHTTEQLAQLSRTVADLAHNLTTTAPPSLTLLQGLRLPNLVLPHYMGKDLKIIRSTIKILGNVFILGADIEKCSPSEFQQHYEACINAFKAKRGKPRDHQLRELFGTYYTMCQQANESVADFAHRFRETQHELEKLLPAIHQGASLSLPLDSCCSLSLVSKAHADIVAQKHPHLTFTKLQSPLPVAVATRTSHLKAIGIMQFPIVWENGRPSIFSMLVVPHLAWPILFGQDHLRKTQGQTDHA